MAAVNFPGLSLLKPSWTTLFNPHTFPKSLEPLKEACIAKDTNACAQLAQHFEQGRLVDRNMEVVSAIYEDCCNLGGGACCVRKGEYYAKQPETTIGVTCWFPHSSAREYFSKGCDAGDGRSCAALSELLMTKKCVRDLPGAMKSLQRAIDITAPLCYDAKQAHQCWALADFYDFMSRVQPKDSDQLKKKSLGAYDSAAQIFRTRCDADGTECLFLGDVLQHKWRSLNQMKSFPDLTVSLDTSPVKETKPVEKAPQQHIEGQLLKEAQSAYEKGCIKFSNTSACAALGDWHMSGIGGLPRDAVLVTAYLARSCRLQEETCGLLGDFYNDNPELMPPDLKSMPLMLYKLSCRAGNKSGCHRETALQRDEERKKSQSSVRSRLSG